MTRTWFAVFITIIAALAYVTALAILTVPPRLPLTLPTGFPLAFSSGAILPGTTLA
ncbi:MAG: hypothetical protein LBH13_02260 [Cellulomonadaceae bacterium]|nr:hypothetical protein [Cellulomonadaceae bacterium]